MKVIKSFDLDTSDIGATGESRTLRITGDDGALFSLEIKNGVNYYNFQTNSFQANKTKLHDISITGGFYAKNIRFPVVTVGAQYDIYLMANGDTEHSDYDEVRFEDGSMDINSTTGSNSKLIQKVIYQTLDTTITINGYSPNGTITGANTTSATILSKRGGVVNEIPFRYTFTVTSTRTLSINKQPTAADIMAFVVASVGAVPVIIPGEDIYPAVNNTDIVDGTGFAAGTSTKLVMNTNVADKMAVGDKITIATTDLTDTINGAVSSGVKVVMDSNVATKMAVGDRITAAIAGVPHALLRASHSTIVTVAALDPDGDNVKEFSMSEAVSLSDGETLTFTPKCNRELFTVSALDPDEDNTKEFSYVDAAGGTTSRLGVMDNAVLSFSNQMNYQWPIDNFIHIIDDSMIISSGGNATADSSVRKYQDVLVISPNTANQRTIIKKEVPATRTLAIKPVITRGDISTQEGAVVFDKQQVLALAGDTLKIGGYGRDKILSVYGYDILFSDLAIALTPITTTTTAAVSNSTSVVVTSRTGILDAVSTVSGIGINPSLVDPTVASGAGAVTGAGTIVLSAAQTIEDGATLAFANAGQTATITGSIQVLKAGSASQTLRFDVDKLLSIT